MVARTPPKQRKMAARPPPPHLNPTQLRETVKKVDQCMARLQELQYTVSGGNMVVSGKNLSPISTRGYLKTSMRCKQESIRMKSSAAQKSPIGKFQGSSVEGEWRRMSLPAMLVGETVGEILQASQFAREIVASVGSKPNTTAYDDPRTPLTQQRSQKKNVENTELRARRKREKQVVHSIKSESDSPKLQRARSRINFKVTPNKRETGKETCFKLVSPNKSELRKENWRVGNHVSPRNKPWAKKTVLFPNPLFHSSPTSTQHKFGKTRSPVISRARQSPHKFLIKSPIKNSKFHVKIKSPPVCLSPTRATSKKSPKLSKALSPNKKSPKMSTASRFRRSLSPAKLANRLVSPLRNRMSPMKSRMSVQKSCSFMSGLKQLQLPSTTSRRYSDWRI